MLSTRFSAPEGNLTGIAHRFLIAGLILACALGAQAEAAVSADAAAPRTDVATTTAVSPDLSAFAEKTETFAAIQVAGRYKKASKRGGKTPRGWDYVLRNGDDLKRASSYIRSVAQSMFRDAVGSSTSMSVGYLAPNYMGYSKPSGGKYIRHTGLDLPKGVGSPVRALAPGKVVSVITKNPLDAAVIVKENGASRYWVYGHVQGKVRRNQNVGKGTVVGSIINPRGKFRPHVHVSVLTTPFPVRGSLRNNLGWGRTKGGSPKEAEETALRYTMQPLEAYARANGMFK